MQFWDLHCDTVTECKKQGLSLAENSLHLDVKRGGIFDAWVQTYAIWLPDTIRVDAAWQYYTENRDFFYAQVSRSDVMHCRSFAQIEASVREKQAAAVLAVEGGAVLGGDIEKLDRLHADGVRILTLTWNAENELGFGCQSTGGHLKPFGKSVVRRMETLHMLPDVSHLDRIGFWDVLELTDRPVLASHSTSEAVLDAVRKESNDKLFSMRRALTDEQILALASHGGLIGLNFCGSFLGDKGEDGFDAALRHAVHIMEIGAEDILAVGSDFDGCDMHPSLSGIEHIPALYTYFRQNGLSDALCEKVFFKNACQFFQNVL